MPSTRHEFSETTLTELLRALRARTSRHPDNPDLIASWPGVREDRIAAALRRTARPRPSGIPRVDPERQPRQDARRLGHRCHDGGAGVPSVIVLAESETDEPSAFNHDRRAFRLKERVTSSDVSDPHVAAQLIERIGWALADAEDAERAASGSKIGARSRPLSSQSLAPAARTRLRTATTCCAGDPKMTPCSDPPRCNWYVRARLR
jgi:hypothetical protein